MMMADLPDEVGGPMMADLPDEMWCYIFDHLDVEELKVASLVCRRWSSLTFSGRRMKRVLLYINTDKDQFQLDSKRKYENVTLYSSQAMRTACSKFREIFLELRNVQSLEIGFEYLNTNEQIISDSSPSWPVLEKLKELKFETSLLCWASEALNWFEIAPYLQSLEMGCYSKRQLSIYEHFKEQLRHISVGLRKSGITIDFFRLSFPSLKRLTLRKYQNFDEQHSEPMRNFLQRHPHLRRLEIISDEIDEMLIKTVTGHCKLLTELIVYTSCDMAEGLFKSLAQLTKLEYFSFRGFTEDRDIFNGCGTILSLKSFDLTYPLYSVGVDFWKKFFKIAPQISSLTTIVDTPTLHFICENFKNLSSFELIFDGHDQEESDALARIDQLARLKKLVVISWSVRNVVFPHSNARCLTVKTCKKLTDEDLLKVPERFPMLKRLTIKHCNLVSVAGINLLHKSIPTCSIDLNGQRFYPLA